MHSGSLCIPQCVVCCNSVVSRACGRLDVKAKLCLFSMSARCSCPTGWISCNTFSCDKLCHNARNVFPWTIHYRSRSLLYVPWNLLAVGSAQIYISTCWKIIFRVFFFFLPFAPVRLRFVKKWEMVERNSGAYAVWMCYVCSVFISDASAIVLIASAFLSSSLSCLCVCVPW